MASRHRPAPEDGFCRNREIAYLADEYPLFNLGQLGLDCRGQVVAVEEAVEVLGEGVSSLFFLGLTK